MRKANFGGTLVLAGCVLVALLMSSIYESLEMVFTIVKFAIWALVAILVVWIFMFKRTELNLGNAVRNSLRWRSLIGNAGQQTNLGEQVDGVVDEPLVVGESYVLVPRSAAIEAGLLTDETDLHRSSISELEPTFDTRPVDIRKDDQ